MKITAVIVTYNRKALLTQCLEAVLNQTRKPDEVVVLNNASTDGTKELLKSKYFKRNDVIILNLNKNTGGAGGFYYSIKKAYDDGADWVWAMDDDCIPYLDALEKLIEATNIVDASFFASTVWGPDGEFMNVPSVSTHVASNGYADWYSNLKDKMISIESATLVSLLISRRSIDACGLPHKDFFLWGDDTEYTLRLTRTFKPAFFVGDSKVIHMRNGEKALSLLTEPNKSRIKLYKYLVRNTYVYTTTYKGRKALLKLYLSNFVKFFKTLLWCNFKMLRLSALIVGTMEYWFGCYNKKGFDNRFRNHLEDVDTTIIEDKYNSCF